MIEPIHGVVVVDKPVGPTSFAIVRQARRMTGARKVGHGGTLDPLASGVLPICFGEATKLAQFLLDADKEYEATVRFGVETDTYDSTGTITAVRSAGHLGAAAVTSALTGFLGEQAQVPPMYSALKRAGRPLYSYARAGQIVERPPRTIRIHAIELRAFAPVPFAATETAAPARSTTEAAASVPGPEAKIVIACSKGTYVRALAHDLGQAVGTGAHLVALRRTRSGPFVLAQAIAPEALSTRPMPIVSLTDALAHLPRVRVSSDAAWDLARGKRIQWTQVTPPPSGEGESDIAAGLVRILAPTGELLAVARRGEGADELIRTVRVFNASG